LSGSRPTLLDARFREHDSGGPMSDLALSMAGIGAGVPGVETPDQFSARSDREFKPLELHQNVDAVHELVGAERTF
jgi:hypothetical protein